MPPNYPIGAEKNFNETSETIKHKIIDNPSKYKLDLNLHIQQCVTMNLGRFI